MAAQSKRGRPCSICSNVATRRAVDGALITGATVAEVIALYSSTLDFSAAAAYRHARHANSTDSPLGVPRPEGEQPADLARHLVSVLSAQQAQLERGMAETNSKLTDAASDRLRAVVHEMADLVGIDAVHISEQLHSAQLLVNGMRRAALHDPSTIAALAAAYRHAGDHQTADDLAALAAHATARTTNKEKPS